VVWDKDELFLSFTNRWDAVYYCVKNDADFNSRLIKKSRDGYLGSFETNDEYELGCARVHLLGNIGFLLTITDGGMNYLSLFDAWEQVLNDVDDHFRWLHENQEFVMWFEKLRSMYPFEEFIEVSFTSDISVKVQRIVLNPNDDNND
jgi:hypothetical protein